MTEKAFSSAELARAVGISTDALRHYERLGVLPRVPRTSSGYRMYPPESLERVRMVRHALQLGFTLRELAEILRVRDRGGAPCQRVLGMLQEKLDALQQRIAELQQTKKYMQSMVSEWSSRLANSQAGEKAFLLRSLKSAPSPANEIREPLRRNIRMKKMIRALVPMFLVAAASQLPAQAQTSQEQPCPMHASHMASDAHHAAVESHGDHAMGFPHDKTTHHFRLTESGGSIQVTANDPKDSANIDAIRTHLAHIIKAFGDGDYSAPMFVHDMTPPGVTTMKLLKEKIHFEYLAVDSGGHVQIASQDPVARAAIHDFLRFQITDHATGDPLDPDAVK